jgi:hypothetical protein
VVKDCNKIKNISVAIAGVCENSSNLAQQDAPLKNKRSIIQNIGLHNPPRNIITLK